MDMENEKPHIVPYATHGLTLAILLILTCVTILAPLIHFSTLTVTISISIASVKGLLVMFNFMHLKYEKRIFKVVGMGVIVLFVSIVLITMLDYWYR
jgi:cytochrome c oxidase subunit IV